jgi:ligand-binding SRPBCC domain-containing protein
MKIKINTAVKFSMENVWNGFTQKLFLKLAPPFPPVKLVRFDGCLQGNIVSMELNFILFKQNWTSLISEQKTDENEIYFIDEGTELPFFLKSWKHKHRIVKIENNSEIIDEIEYKTPTILTDYLFYPILYAQFAYRKPIYRKIFNNKP